MLYLLVWETIELKAVLPLFSRRVYKCPPDKRKEGETYVYYISGINSDRNIHCCPCKSLL